MFVYLIFRLNSRTDFDEVLYGTIDSEVIRYVRKKISNYKRRKLFKNIIYLRIETRYFIENIKNEI